MIRRCLREKQTARVETEEHELKSNFLFLVLAPSTHGLSAGAWALTQEWGGVNSSNKMVTPVVSGSDPQLDRSQVARR